jgi:hypothetical protein
LPALQDYAEHFLAQHHCCQIQQKRRRIPNATVN